MPYASDSEVPPYVPKKKRAQWREVWNSSYNTHHDESRAFAEANSVTGHSSKTVEDNMHEIRKEGGDPGALHIFVPLVKVDVAKREVWGVVTAEVPDKENEVCDYDTTIPYYKDLVDEMSKATDGVNIFPLREMHGLSAAGKGISIEFREGTKEVYMGFRVVDDAAWKKVEECVYTGFSQGGRYVKKWKDGEYTKYTAKPSEVSLVDLPCLTRAHFDYVKADGTVEKRAFKKDIELPTEVGPIPTTPTSVSNVSAADLSLVAARENINVPSEEEKVAIEAGKTEKTKYLSDNNDRVNIALEETLTDVINNRAFGEFGKGMYSVSCFAEIIEQLKYLWLSMEYEREVEGDESPATDDLKDIFSNLLDAFLSYTEEQVQELSAHAAAFEGGLAMATENADLDKAAKFSMASHFKKAASHHEHIAATHVKMTKAHDGAADHHEQMGKAEGADKAHHKMKAAFHKTMGGHHEALTKRHNSHAEHLHKMAASCSEADAGKAVQLSEIDELIKQEDTLSTTSDVVKTEAVKTEGADVKVDPATIVIPASDFNDNIKKALDTKLTEAVNAAFERVLNSGDFNNMVDQAIAKKLLDKLGSSPVNTEIKTFPVPRTSSSIEKGIDRNSLDPELHDFVGI